MNSTWLNIFSFFDVMFGCTHRNYSFPFTPKDRHRCSAASITGTYVVCLGCGKEFPYDWHAMKVVSGDSSASEPLPKPVKSYVNRAA